MSKFTVYILLNSRSSLVYKIPYRRARAWPSASREQRYLAYKIFPSYTDVLWPCHAGPYPDFLIGGATGAVCAARHGGSPGDVPLSGVLGGQSPPDFSRIDAKRAIQK